jgi:putative peptide maturation system protein
MTGKRGGAHTGWNRTVLSAIALLKQLPQDHGSLAATRAQFRAFQAEHGKVRCELLSVRRPGSAQIDLDILLTDGDGTLTLGWADDDGVPWMVQHAEHNAANQLLTVNGNSLPVQSALILLNTSLKQRPDLMEQLITSMLLSEAVEASPPPVSEREIDRAVDDLRIANGLYLASDTEHWLEETGLSIESLREIAAYRVRLRKFTQARFAAEAKRHFDTQRDAFDRVTAFGVRAGSRAAAQALARAARRDDLWSALNREPHRSASMEAELLTRLAHELPSVVAAARSGAVIGPVEMDGHHEVWQVQHRARARFDAATKAAVQDLLLKRWLAERRAEANVKWHWM